MSVAEQSFAGTRPSGLCRHPDSGMSTYGYASDADIATVADFGCVQFRARPAAGAEERVAE